MKDQYLMIPFKTKRFKHRINTAKISNGDFDDIFDELQLDNDDAWHDKAKKLQARRWRRIKRGLD